MKAIIFIMFYLACSNSYLNAQENIALGAEVQTSFVSTWETLGALNDGFDPLNSADNESHGAYGNWSGTDNYNKWNWVEYDFEGYYTIARSQVYWWDDGQGIEFPYDNYLQYWDIINKQWIVVENVIGYGIAPDRYNPTTFDTVLTNKIRLNFISTAAQGILEWQVFGSKGEQLPDLSYASINPELAKNATSTVTLACINSNAEPVQGYIFKVNAKIKNSLSTTAESYIINGQAFMYDAEGIVLPATNSEGIVNFNISIPPTIDPCDGIQISAVFNSGYTKLFTGSIYEPGMEPPVLTADASNNNVDNNINITFTDDATWRNAITSVKIDGMVLTPLIDYIISSDNIVLIPSGGNNAISKSGVKMVVIEALGYKSTTATQTILAGAVSASKSKVETLFNFYRSAITTVNLTALDQFENPVSNYFFKLDANIIDTTSTNSELYIVNGTETNINISNMTLVATGTDGKTTFKVKISDTVDIGDGIILQLQLNDGSTNVRSAIGYIAKTNEKSVYVPNGLKSAKEWSYDKIAQSDNFAIFWGNKTGPDPLKPSVSGMGFNPDNMLKELETYYAYYVDTMDFISNNDSGKMAKYKMFIIMNNTWENGTFVGNTPTGGSSDNKIGGMWVPPGTSGFVLAHEFAHSICAMVPIQYPGHGIKDPAIGIVGMIWESTANLMGYMATNSLGSISPAQFINNSMMQYLTTINMRHYDRYYFQIYLMDKYGIKALGKFWQMSVNGEHPFEALMHSESLSRQEMNAELCRYAMHNVTWDYSFKGIGTLIKNKVQNYSASTVCREFTILDTIAGQPGKYIVPRQLAPADYGYNIIKVYPNEEVKSIRIRLSAYSNSAAEGTCISYGLVAVDKNGQPRYSDIYNSDSIEANFAITSNDSSFYLVTIATPPVSHSYSWTPGWPKVYRYPYSIEFEGALPAGYKQGYNSLKNSNTGAPHLNGGGWVASTANVHASAYVGPDAQVIGAAQVLDNASIEGFAIVRDNAKISGNSIIKDHCVVGGTTNVSGNATIEKLARVFGGNISENAVITGSAMVFNSSLKDYSVIGDLAEVSGLNLSGTVVIGGDATGLSACSAGTYLQTERTGCDKKDFPKTNIDINVDPSDYIFPFGSIPTAPSNLTYSFVTDTSVVLDWSASNDNSETIYYLSVSGELTFGRTTELKDTLYNIKAGTEYTFRIVARDASANTSAASNSVTFVTLPSSTIESNSLEKCKVYPNPVKDEFKIELNSSDLAKVIVYDSNGRLIYENCFKNNTVINKNQLGNSGIYIVKITTDKEVVVRKIILE